MTTNSLFKFSSILLVIAIALSSCNSSIQISKKRHSKGFYVSVGSNNDSYESKARPVVMNKTSNETVETASAATVEEVIAENNSLTEKERVSTISTSMKKIETSTIKVASKKKSSKLKKALKLRKALKKQDLDGSDSMIILLLLLILAVFIPPLAVFLMKGVSKPFWINLILALIGWGALLILAPGLVWLGGIAAIVHAILIVLGII